MKTKNILCGLSIAVVLQLGMLAGAAQTNIYLFSGSERNITLNPGTYIITAYGAPGAFPSHTFAPLGGWGGSGAEMSAEFNFSTSTTLTLLVGGGGYPYSPANNRAYAGGGGGGGSFVVQGSTPLVIAGGGGGGPGTDNSKYYPGSNGNVSTNGGSAIDGPKGIYSYGGGGTDGGGGGGGGGGGNGVSGVSEGSGGGGGGFLR